MDSLIHLVGQSGCLSITVAFTQTDRLMDRQTARGYYSSVHSGHAIKNYPKTKTNFFFWKTWIKTKTLIKLLLYELYYCYCN